MPLRGGTTKPPEWISQAGFFAHSLRDDADFPSSTHYATKIGVNSRNDDFWDILIAFSRICRFNIAVLRTLN